MRGRRFSFEGWNRPDVRGFLEDGRVGVRFLSSLPGYLRRPVGLSEAREVVRRLIEQREAAFLAAARRAVYAQSASPYRRLLSVAGCEFGDLEALVRQEGVEGSLEVLYRRGVYLTVGEFKGRQAVVRGSASFRIERGAFRNPGSRVHMVGQTGGSRGTPAPVPLDLDHIRDRALLTGLPLALRGGAEWRTAVLGVPGGSATTLLQYSLLGRRPSGWFLQVDPATAGLQARYRWSTRALRWGSVLAGSPSPQPRSVRGNDLRPVARWVAETLAAGQTAHLDTSASAAVHLCETALAAGFDLRGAQLTLGREPITSARLAAIRRSGAEAVPRYATVECGPIGYGCLAPSVGDELHLHHDSFALIRSDGGGLPRGGLALTTLRPAAPLMLMNVSLGDQAEMASRRCGCPLEELGWTTHLHTVRSFEKLTAGGMTFLDTDVIGVLEEVLPARFGGGPTDYQLVEEEQPDGRPCLRLLVHPALGPLDGAQVADAFLEAIGAGSGAARLMALQWRAAGILRVERQPPIATGSGKILHLHQQRSEQHLRG